MTLRMGCMWSVMKEVCCCIGSLGIGGQYIQTVQRSGGRMVYAHSSVLQKTE